MSIGFHDDNYDTFDNTSLPNEIGVSIHHCQFLNNTSDPLKSTASTGQVLQAFVFTGRGGALTIAINSLFEFNVSITHCVVEDNYARSFGGGIYLVFSGYSPHLSTVNDTVFVNNTSPGSGGLSLGYVEGSVGGQSVRMEVHSCRFKDNHATEGFGGGIYLYADSRLIV